MKLKNKRISASALSVCALLSFSAVASAQSNYNWNTGTGTWDTSSSNWTGAGAVWANGNNAIFNNTAAATTVTLSSGLTASSVVIGNGGNNANYTFTGGSLSATTFRLQGAGGNDPGTAGYPLTSLTDATVTVSGDIGIGRGRLVIGGNSTVTADRIGGAGIGGVTSADWGQLTIQDNANVTATNGISGGTTAWGLNLNGGTLTTSSINYGPHAWGTGRVNLNFNGTLIKASSTNANFITTTSGFDFSANVQSGGARFDSNGFDIGVGIVMSGTGALTKSGTGTLTLGAVNTYAGGTFVNDGTLALSVVNAVTGAVTVNGSSAILSIGTQGQNLGAVTLTSGAINGSSGVLTSTSFTASAGSISAILAGTGGFTKNTAGTVTITGASNTFTGGVTVNDGVLLLSKGSDQNSIAAGNAVTVNTGGTLRLGATGQIQDTISSFSINGGTFDLQGHVEGVTTAISLNNGTITGTSAGFLLARGGYVGTGTNTISQRLSVRGADVNSGVFNITSGTTTVSSAIYTDPFGTASGITKRGAGTLTLSGTNSYAGNTTVEAGTLIVNGTIANATTTTVQSGATISGSGSVGSLTVNSGATINPGNSPGTLTVNGTYSQAGTLVAEIAGISSGQYDQLIVNGTVNLTGSLTAQFSGTGYSLNDMVFLLVNDSTDAIGGNGIFTGLAQGATVTTFGGFDWVISYNADSVGNTFTGGNDIALRAIPEPSAALLGGLGVLGLLRRRRRHVA